MRKLLKAVAFACLLLSPAGPLVLTGCASGGNQIDIPAIEDQAVDLVILVKDFYRVTLTRNGADYAAGRISAEQHDRVLNAGRAVYPYLLATDAALRAYLSGATSDTGSLLAAVADLSRAYSAFKAAAANNGSGGGGW